MHTFYPPVVSFILTHLKQRIFPIFLFFCEASISVKFKSNARETWHAILVSFADIYPTESLCILHFVPVGTKPEVVTLIILALQFPIIRIKHRCRGTHCDGVGNRFSQIYTHYRIWHKMR